MKTRLLFVMLLTALILVACAGGPVATEAPPMDIMPGAKSDAGGVAVQEPAAEEAPAPDVNALPEGAIYDTGADVPAADYNRMVIKNAEIDLLVKDSDVAIDGITQIVGDVRGYIISSQLWYEAYYDTNYKYATLTIGVPADQFETVLRRLRNLSIRVLNENASGQDVTDQYVDLQSQLTNLEATRDRIKSFLDDAKTVDEALRINQQLSEIEGQIEQVKGQMNYLADRAAFSTITITVRPDLPVIVSTPTPTPTPVVWDPGETWKESTETLTNAYRGIAEFLIWFFVVLVPILAPWILIGWVLWRVLRRKPKA